MYSKQGSSKMSGIQGGFEGRVKGHNISTYETAVCVEFESVINKG